MDPSEDDLAETQRLLDEFRSHDGWSVCRNDAEMIVQHQHLPGQQEHGFKFSVLLETNISELVSLGRELDLLPTWHRFVNKAEILNLPELFKVWGFGQVWAPWPLNSRNVCGKAVILNLLNKPTLDEEGGIFALIRPLTSEDRAQVDAALEPLMQGGVELSLRPSGVLVRPRYRNSESSEPSHYWVDLIMFVDPGIPKGVPNLLLDFFLKVLAPWVVRKIRTMLQEIHTNPDHEFRQRIAANPEFYETLNRLSVEHTKALHTARQLVEE
eukprot:c17783_g1_i3.p1 GENE.c17783_g1_i3~~c17783_g1_i3.p1  ORF type:complete len:269 (+),score=46.26 c17783_g1_i3:27-833(+)